MKIYKYLVIFLSALTMFGCSNSNDSMTKLDKEYDGYAKEAAEKFLNNEIDSYSWENVTSGDLEYEYTLYNEELNAYKVKYITEFNKENSPEDEWIEISVFLTGNTKSVEDVECSYWDAIAYEVSYGRKYVTSEDDDGTWYNINLTEDEIKKLKEENEN